MMNGTMGGTSFVTMFWIGFWIGGLLHSEVKPFLTLVVAAGNMVLLLV